MAFLWNSCKNIVFALTIRNGHFTLKLVPTSLVCLSNELPMICFDGSNVLTLSTCVIAKLSQSGLQFFLEKYFDCDEWSLRQGITSKGL